MTERESAGAYGLNVGTYEEGLEHIGRPSEVRFAELPVNEAMVRQFVSAVRDPNPLYWDQDLATRDLRIGRGAAGDADGVGDAAELAARLSRRPDDRAVGRRAVAG